MSLIMPGGGRTVNWGLPGVQRPQMPPTRGPEQLAWQQQNPSQPQPRPSGGFSAYGPGQAQSQQSPYSTATPYGQPKPQNQGPQWNQGGTNQQQTRQPDLTQYMSPGNPMRGGNSYQQAPQQSGQPQWTQALPYGGQNAGIPPFQFRATDFMGNQFSDPGAFTAQQGAMAQALNQQRAQGIGQGQFGPLNPQMAYQQGAEMVQGGWQNPFAAPQPENQIRRLIDYPGPMPQQGAGSPAAGAGVNQNAPPRPILMAPGSPGDRERPPVTPGTAQPIPPQVPAGRQANMNAFTRADAPPGQRFDNVAYEAQLRTLRDEVAAKTRAGNRNGAAQSQRSLDSLMERRDYLRAQAEDNVAGANQALQAIGRTRSAARPAGASSQSDRSGDRVVGGFNYSAAEREYEAGRQKRVQSPANQRWLASMSPANRRAYGFMQ